MTDKILRWAEEKSPAVMSGIMWHRICTLCDPSVLDLFRASGTEFFKYRLSLFQIGSIETFVEQVIDF